MAPVFPDAMAGLRTWLRTHPDLTGLHGGRVFFRVPDGPVYPLVRIYRAGGAVQPGDAPLLDIRVAVEVWGGALGDYPAVSALATAIESACHRMPAGLLLDPAGTTVGLNAQVSTWADVPDPDTGWPRRVGDLVLTCRTA